MRATRYFGQGFWKRLTGYYVRSRAEDQMCRLKSLESAWSHETPTQTAEVHILKTLLNRFSAQGRAEITRVV